MADELIAFLDAIGPVRGFLLVGAAFAAWRATTLHRLDDYRSPLPWAVLVIVCIAVLAMLSLSTYIFAATTPRADSLCRTTRVTLRTWT